MSDTRDIKAIIRDRTGEAAEQAYVPARCGCGRTGTAFVDLAAKTVDAPACCGRPMEIIVPRLTFA